MPRRSRSPMKTKAAAVSNKAALDEDDDEPKKIRSSRSKRRHTGRSSTESESPPRKRSKKPSKKTADKKSKRSKVSSSSSRRRRRSPSPSPSLSSSSSPSSVSRSSSDRSVSSPPRSRSRDVKKRKGRGRDRERDLKRRKARRSTSSSSSGSSRSRSKSSKRSTKDGATRHEIGKDYESTDYFHKDEEALVAKKGRYEIERYEKNVSLEKIENPPSKDASETDDILPADSGSPAAEDLELILRQKALDNLRKFRAAAAMAGKTDNRATRKELATDNPHSTVMKVVEARSAAITPSRGQANSHGARRTTESLKSEDFGNGKSPWTHKSSDGMSHRAGSPSRILQNGDTGGTTQQEGTAIEATYSTSQPRSPQDDRYSRSVMQRLVDTPGSASSLKQRLGSSAGVSNVNGAPRIKSVVSIPAREERDGGSTQQRPNQNSAPVESSSAIDMNKAEGTNGADRKMSEASASDGSLLSSAEGKRQGTEATRIEDKDGSQFQKKTFSRMHDGETVEVSYKVYVPKKTPALERRKLQR